MEEKKIILTIGAFESMQARNYCVIHRLIAVIIIQAIIIGFLIYNELQYSYDDTLTTTTDTITVDSEGNGVANYIGNDGEINNGKNNSDTDNSYTPENENQRS